MKKIIFLILTILWIIFIFSNSLKSGIDSTQSSSTFVDYVNGIFHSLNINIDLNNLPISIRKIAHVFEFFILSVFVYVLFSELINRYLFLAVMTLCTFIAIIDEMIQFFVPGRVGSIIDVIIDICGALIGVAICFIIKYLINHKKNKTILNKT